MRAYILRRLLISVPLVFLMTFLVFAVINLNPEASIQRYVMQPNVSFQFIEQEKERLGLYDPLPMRYLRWLGGVLGDIRFGRETRALISFADAGALRSTFGLTSAPPTAHEDVRHDAEVVRPARGRPYAALPFLGKGHTHTFKRLGSPYTRLVLPRSDWAPVGKVIAVEDVGGEPTEIIETRGFRSLRLDVGNPLTQRQTAELLLTSGQPESTTVVAIPFTVAPYRRETLDFPLSELEQRGVDMENVLHLGIRATAPGALYLTRTLLVVDERPFSVGWVPNFGTSYENNIPVLRRLGGRVRNTILLVVASMLLTWAVALPFGVIAAVRQYSATDRFLSFVSFIGMALPGFFLAILVRYVAGLADDPNSFLSFLPALPTSGRVSANHDQLSALGQTLDILRHALLPVLVLAMGGMAGMQRVMRGTMLETLRQPYITTARAKGLSERVVIYKHALRNAITPFVAGFGSILPALIGGSALIEIVFNYPGVGQLMLPAVLNRDINLVMGNTLIAALLLVLGNLIADILLALVDPRVSYD